MMYRTYIFEDIFFDLEAIKSILARIPEVQIIDHGSTIGEALRTCEEKKPDLIIADSDMYGDKQVGPNFVRAVKQKLPEVRILGMTRHADCIETLKRAGCDYVVNKSLIENHEAAVKFLRETLLPKPQYAVDLRPPTLTQEEDQVLRMICEGQTENEIAEKLGAGTRKPIRNVKLALFDKFGALNSPNLVYLAYKSGYLNPGET